jgi:uncharacterized protein YbaR (Trm112 family)
MKPGELIQILKCPVCEGALEDRLEEHGGYDCAECRLRYVLEGDILNMLPAQALELEEK